MSAPTEVTFPFPAVNANISLLNPETIHNPNASSMSTTNSIPERNENLARVEITILSMILFIAIIGNSLMLLALRRQLLTSSPMSRMYFFMLNLSIADLFVAFGNILPQLAWDITYRFQGNDLLCRIVKFLQVFVLYLSTFVLTGMAIDRYLVVCHHSFSRNYYSRLKGPKILVGVAYILSFVLAAPQAFLFSYMEIPGSGGVTDCWVKFIEPWGEKAYVTFFVAFAFIVPLAVIAASYFAIACKVIRFHLPEKENNQKPGEREKTDRNQHSFSSSSEQSKNEPEIVDKTLLQQQLSEEIGTVRLQKQISKAKIKTLKLTLTVVICFFLCWAPFCITQLVITYNPQNPGPLQVIFLLLASLNSCTNPWIYLFFSKSLCNQLRATLGLGIRRASDSESVNDKEHHPQNQGRLIEMNRNPIERKRNVAKKKILITVFSEDLHVCNGDQGQVDSSSISWVKV